MDIRSFFCHNAAAACFALFAFWTAASAAQTPLIRIIWASGNLIVPAYSTGTYVEANIDDIAGNPPLMIQGWDLTGNRLRAIIFSGDGCTASPGAVECSFAPRPPVSPIRAALPPLAPGEYILEVTNADGLLDNPASQTRTLSVIASPPVITVATVGYRPANKFFLGADASDINTLTGFRDFQNRPVWAVAEPMTLRAWPAKGPAPDAAKEVCRLFHPLAQTHFFSGNPADCAAIRATAPWRDEGIAFRALLPAAGGVCPIGTDPVWRLFSNKFTTHRYTRNSTTYSAFQADGWSGEGVVFCSAPA